MSQEFRGEAGKKAVLKAKLIDLFDDMEEVIDTERRGAQNRALTSRRVHDRCSGHTAPHPQNLPTRHLH